MGKKTLMNPNQSDKNLESNDIISQELSASFDIEEKDLPKNFLSLLVFLYKRTINNSLARISQEGQHLRKRRRS